MIRPINIYATSRNINARRFEIIEHHNSQKPWQDRVRKHEKESLKLLADYFVSNGIDIGKLDGFFLGYKIPQIGQEFDLLKFKDEYCLNIELKSQEVSQIDMLNQLKRNRYYLNGTGKVSHSFTIITDSMRCFGLNNEDELFEVHFDEIVQAVDYFSIGYTNTIEGLFLPSNYLVSPFNSPKKFLNDEYFLTLQQNQIKKDLLFKIQNQKEYQYHYITGGPGTGKTLLLYDIAKTLAVRDKTLIVHCGSLCNGQRKIRSEIENLDIISASEVKYETFPYQEYTHVLVDESHRIFPYQFYKICNYVEKNKKNCIFSSDPNQVLSKSEKSGNIAKRIKSLNHTESYSLTERIRTNYEIYSFTRQLFDLSDYPDIIVKYPHVYIHYANNKEEALALINYFETKEFEFINFTGSFYNKSPYSEYPSKRNTHKVIGQEYDSVVMLLDDSFYYNEENILDCKMHPTPDYIYTNLLYQGVTRARTNLSLIILNNEELLDKILTIIDQNR